MNGNTLLGQEWQTLQNNHEQHEKHALLIKLACLALCLGGLAAGVAATWLALVVVLCWLQEGIFKTYQGRLAERLLDIEALLGQSPSSGQAMQLHTAWSARRPRGLGLIAGYTASACRPTVAFPYAAILAAGGVAKVLGGL